MSDLLEGVERRLENPQIVARSQESRAFRSRDTEVTGQEALFAKLVDT